MRELVSIIGGIIVALLFTLAVLYLFTIPARDITLDDIPPGAAPYTNQKEPAPAATSPDKNQETDSGSKEKADYYIIIGSIRGFTNAQQKADRLINEFNANIIILPPTTEGFYRITCGRCSTLMEAKSTIKSIRAKINPDAWILKVKKDHNTPQ